MTEIRTERLILRSVTENDAEDIYEYSKDPEIGPKAGWKPHESVEETKKLFPDIFLKQPSVFAIVMPENGKVIGTIGLINDEKRSYDKVRMLGYALGKEYHCRGYMTEAAKAVIEYGFKTMGLELISAYCYPFNKASQRVIEKCGFMYEGTLKMSELRYDGTLLDEICYSISKDEYLGITAE